MRYIELNPVRAGMVSHPREYRWSSYGLNALGEVNANTHWLMPHQEYLRLARSDTERQSAYRQCFRGAISQQDLQQIRESSHKGWALGSDWFKQQMEVLSQRRVVSKGVGRPRKELG